MASTWFGVGFRTQHEGELAAAPGAVDWLEILVDAATARARVAALERLRAQYPLALHGVSLDVAGGGPIDTPHLDALCALARRLEPAFVSDHLCWTSFGGHESQDLLPVAYTDEVLDHVSARVSAVQERLGRPLLLENASAYVRFCGDQWTEAEFLAALCARTGCGVLLDVNNLYVNAANLGVDPARWLAAIPVGAVGYLHLAGHAVLPDVRIDTHDADVPDPVWELYGAVARRFPHAHVIVERDDAIPPFAALAAEADRARARHPGASLARAAPPRSAAPAASAQRPPPPRWRAVQKDFFARLVDKPVGFAHEDLGALLDDACPVRAARGMRVYSDAYTAGLRRALATNFPALARVLRGSDFAALAAAYLRAHPPQHPDFTRLGARLADFVRRFELSGYGVTPEALADLVALEQAQLEVQNEAAAPAALEPAALAAIEPAQWAGARFSFAPALRLVFARHDVLPAVLAAARGEDPERPHPGERAYLVWRSDGKVRTEAIPPAEARVLDTLRAGFDFAAACAQAVPRGDDAARAGTGVRALLAACARGLVARA
jgi:hypothetical protein